MFMSTLLVINSYGCGFNFSGACQAVVPTIYTFDVDLNTASHNPQPLTTERLPQYERFLGANTGQGRPPWFAKTERIGNVAVEALMEKHEVMYRLTDPTHELTQTTRIGSEDGLDFELREQKVLWSSIEFVTNRRDLPAFDTPESVSIDHPLIDLMLEGAIAIFEPRLEGERLTKKDLWSLLSAYYGAETIREGGQKEYKPGFRLPETIRIDAGTLKEFTHISESDEANHSVTVNLDTRAFSVRAAYGADWEAGLHKWIQSQITRGLGYVIVPPANNNDWSQMDPKFFPYIVVGNNLVQVRRG